MQNQTIRDGTARTLTLLLVSTLTVMAGATLAPALPAMERAFAHEPDVALRVKMVMTVPGLAIALGAPVWGALLDRRAKKPLLLAALLLYGVAGVSGFFVMRSLPLILVGRALLGIAVAGVMTSCNVLAASYFQGPRLSQYMGLAASVGGFGSVLFLAAGGALAELGYQFPFLVFGFALLLMPAARKLLDEPAVVERAALQESAAEHGAWSGLLRFCALALFEILAFYMVPVHYPFLAQRFSEVGSTQVGLAIACMMLVTALAALAYRALATRISFLWLHALGLLLVAAGYTLLGGATGYVGSLLALAVAGLGFGVVRPNLMVWLLQTTPLPQRGRAIGLVTTSFFVGSFLCPLLSAPVVATLGLPGAFRSVGLCAFALALPFVALALHASTRRPLESSELS